MGGRSYVGLFEGSGYQSPGECAVGCCLRRNVKHPHEVVSWLLDCSIQEAEV